MIFIYVFPENNVHVWNLLGFSKECRKAARIVWLNFPCQFWKQKDRYMCLRECVYAPGRRWWWGQFKQVRGIISIGFAPWNTSFCWSIKVSKTPCISNQETVSMSAVPLTEPVCLSWQWALTWRKSLFAGKGTEEWEWFCTLPLYHGRAAEIQLCRQQPQEPLQRRPIGSLQGVTEKT